MANAQLKSPLTFLSSPMDAGLGLFSPAASRSTGWSGSLNSSASFHSTNGDSGRCSSTSSAADVSEYHLNRSQQTTLKSSFDIHARPLLDTIDSIRSLGLEGRDFQLPKIVVTGDQSVGKTSCLEAFSGIQLPRGDGIVTRTPLELILRTSRNGTAWRCRIRYSDKDDRPIDQEISSPHDVSKAVRAAQKDITGADSGISSKLITLNVESPDVPDLTMIDLPGIIRYSESNDQIENQVIQLIKQFIQPKHTIILAVFPGGTDPDAVGAFRLARDVDPEFKRTMGVITKMDLVGPGSEKFVLETLRNEKLKMNLGMYAVKCRSQDEIEKGIPLLEACKKEEDFFSNHPHFGQYFNANVFGVRKLSEKMVKELINHIKVCLPELTQIVGENLSRIKKKIWDLGLGPSQNEDEKKREFLALLTEYTDVVGKISHGLYRHENRDIKLFTMWRYETEVFANKIRAVTEQGVSDSLQHDEEIRKTLTEQRGNELPGFVNSFPVCESIISRLVVDWATPARDYVAAIKIHVESVLRQLASKTFNKFPNLEAKVKEIVDERLQVAIDATEADIKKIFSEESVVWTQDQTYRAERNDFRQNPEKKLKIIMEDKSDDQLVDLNHNAEDVMEGVSAYMEVACRRIMDTIPQSVLYHSLTVLSAEIKEYVLSIASNTAEVGNLFKEKDDIATRRQELKDLQQRWRKAEKQLAAL